MKPIVIYGAGGFGKEVACIINKINELEPTWEFIGFLDDGIPEGTAISHFGQVLGGYDVIQNWPSPISVVFAIGNPKITEKIVEKLTNPNVVFPNLVHPEAFIADPLSLKMGIGNVVVRGCSFSCDVEVGDFNQFNSISALAHDVKVGAFNVFMPLTRISGEVTIGNRNFFGINSIVLQCIKIGDNTRIGANSLIIKKTKDGHLYLGSPAKLTKL